MASSAEELTCMKVRLVELADQIGEGTDREKLEGRNEVYCNLMEAAGHIKDAVHELLTNTAYGIAES